MLPIRILILLFFLCVQPSSGFASKIGFNPPASDKVLIFIPAWQDATPSTIVNTELRRATEALVQQGLSWVKNQNVPDWSLWSLPTGQQPLSLNLDTLQSRLQVLVPGIKIQPIVRYKPISKLSKARPLASRSVRSGTKYVDVSASQWALNNTGQVLPIYPDPADAQFNDVSEFKDPGISGVDLNADAAWAIQANAEGIVVAVIDTGLATDTKDLEGRITDGYDFCAGQKAVDDDTGHGTSVASLIAANHNDDHGIEGIAPEAVIMPLRALGNVYPTESECTGVEVPAKCYCNTSVAVGEAIIFAQENGADIINMSLGGSEPDQFVRDAIEEAIDTGTWVVAAAGNEGVSNEETPSYPASYDIPGLISVAAHTNNGVLAAFSNFGSSVDIAAPGTSLHVAEPAARDRFEFNNFKDMKAISEASDVDKDSNELKFTAAYKSEFLDTYQGTDFQVDELGNWGLFTVEPNVLNYLIMDAQSIQNQQDGYSPNSVGNWSSRATTVQTFTQLRTIGQTSLAGDDSFSIDVRIDENTEWDELVRYSELEVIQLGIPIDAMYEIDDSDHSFEIRLRPAIEEGSNNFEDIGGVILTDIQLWERVPYEEAELPTHILGQGTSFAAPYVAGVLALLRKKHGSKPAAAIEKHLQLAGQKLVPANSSDDRTIATDRRLDAALALNLGPVLIPNGLNQTLFVSDPKTPYGLPVTIGFGVFLPNQEKVLGVSLSTKPVTGDVQSFTPRSTGQEELVQFYSATITPDALGEWIGSIVVDLDSGDRLQESFAFEVSESAFGYLLETEEDEPAGCGCSSTGHRTLNFLNFILLVLATLAAYTLRRKRL